MAREGLMDDTGYDFGELQAEYEEELKSKFYNAGFNDGYEAAIKDNRADICREFGKEVIKRYRENPDKGFANIMSEVLSEMKDKE